MAILTLAMSTRVAAQAVLLNNNRSLSGIPLNGRLILSSDRDSTLWSSNGTTGGTIQYSTTKAAGDGGYGVLNDKLYFTGLNQENGSELWVTDGTNAGTSLAADIWLGADSSKPGDFIVYNNKLLFTAYTPSTGRELFSYSEGGNATAITDLNVGPPNSFESPIYFVNDNILYFDARNSTGKALYVLQGIGVTKILDLPAGFSIQNYCAMGNKVFFSIANGSNGMRIYQTTDGTAATLVHAFSGATSGVGITQMVEWNNNIYFTATALGINNELWVTDGNTTRMVKEINAGAMGSNPIIMNSVILNGRLIFSAMTDDSGYELWTTDGSEQGTSQLKDINSRSEEGSDPLLFPVTRSTLNLQNSDYYNRTANYNGYIFFIANNGSSGTELWKTDGTSAGTNLVKNINPGATDGANGSYLYTESGLVFGGDDGTGMQPWISDGSSAGTNIITSINPSGSSAPEFLFIWEGDIYLIADNGDGGIDDYYDLYKLQGPYSPLPVSITAFNALASNSNVIVKWNTSSESNTSHFVVMRSTDGIEYTEIGIANASGNSNTLRSYSFVDKDANLHGVHKLYYRLNSIDKDGKSFLSKIVAVAIDPTTISLKIFPNPAHDKILISCNAVKSGVLLISDISGSQRYKKELKSTTNGTHVVDVTSFPAGTYILKLIDGNHSIVQKFVKR